MAGFIFQLFLFGFLPLFVTVATIWIIWHVIEKINGVIDIKSFLAFILVREKDQTPAASV
jgi:hypothetical protein